MEYQMRRTDAYASKVIINNEDKDLWPITIVKL